MSFSLLYKAFEKLALIIKLSPIVTLVLFHIFRFHCLYLFAAATLLFALHAGGLKSSGLILVELIEQYDGVYSQATLLWVLTIKYTVFGLIGELNNTVQCNSMLFNGM